MDGTLIDTEPYWISEERALVESVGGVWTHEHGLALVGNDLLVSARYIIDHSSIAMTPLEVVEHLLDGVVARVSEHTPWRPGARELLDGLIAAGVPCVLVTMSWRRLADVFIGTLPAGTFAHVITGDEVEHGKPHPEPYRAASRALGVPLSECLAIEDSPPGVASAVSAGVRTLAVPHAVPVPEMAGAVQVPTLEGLRPGDLQALFG
jgi:HAD superfamily hydrolase (TIGR01509 family)